MIKILLKQLIIEEFINSLFSNIKINLNTHKSTNYKFIDSQQLLRSNVYAFTSTIYFIHNNKEKQISIARIGEEIHKNDKLNRNHQFLVNEMNKTLYQLHNQNLRGNSKIRYIHD